VLVHKIKKFQHILERVMQMRRQTC